MSDEAPLGEGPEPPPSGAAPPRPPDQSSGSSPRPTGGAVGIAPAGWGVGQVLLGLAVAATAIFIGIGIVAALDPDLESEGALAAAQAAVAIGLIGTALAFAAADSGGTATPLGKLGLRRFGWGAVGLAFAAWLGYVIFASQIAPLLQPEQEDVTRDLGGEEGLSAVLVAGFLIVVAAPISEEVFFRGFVFAGMRRRLPLWTAAAISAIVWGLLHLGGGNLGVALQLTIFGLLLAWLYDQTGSLWPPIIAHAFNNALAFTLLVTDAI